MTQMPRIIGVQAEGSAAIANAFHIFNDEIRSMFFTTVALFGGLMFHDDMLGKFSFQRS